MSTNKKLIIILGLLIVAFVIINRINDPRQRRTDFFKVDTDNLHSIQLQSVNDTLRISRESHKWVIEKPFYFPADNQRVESFIERIIPIQTSTTPVSVSETSHDNYSVTEDTGTLLTFYDINNNILDRAFMGRRDRRTFARRPEDKNVYELLGHIGFLITPNVAPWRQINIVSIPRGLIERIDIQYELNSYSIAATDTLWHYTDSENSFAIRDTNTALRRIFEELEAIPSMRFIDDEYEEHAHLLENPQLVMTITQTDNTVHTLEWGYDRDEGDFIVIKNGDKKHLYLVNANIADRFTIAYQHFQS